MQSDIDADVHQLDTALFPIVIRIFSRHGPEIWSTTVEKPRPLAGVAIPGFGETDHAPVRVRIEYADGTTTDSATED